MQDSISIHGIAQVPALAGLMDERMSRQWAAAEAKAYGWGGVRAVSRAIGMSPHTIRKGSAELAGREANPRRPDPGPDSPPGRRPEARTESDPGLAAALERLVDPATRGDPQSPLRWTCKSTHAGRGADPAGPSRQPDAPSAGLLKAAGYSLQGNRKTKEGGGHPDRNAQFEHINATVKAFQRRGQPVISVDTKKKELVGDFKNGGREWQPQRRARGGARPRLHGQGAGQGDPLRRLRHDGATRAGSASGSTTTRRGSRPKRSAAGGSKMGAKRLSRSRTGC